MMEPLNEKAIIKKLQAGDPAALSDLWKLYSEKILNLAFRTLHDRDEAEDVLMDVFVSIPRAAREFRGESALGTWIYRLAINECFYHLRKAKRRQNLEEENLPLIVERTGIGKKEEFPDLGKILDTALSKLPEDTRGMIWLKDAEGVSIEELSRIYDKPVGTLKARLSRGRERMRKFIKETFYGTLYD